MTVVVLGIDALDPDLVDPAQHPHLTLENYRSIETISSSAGEPSTHELWPTIITGLKPANHGLTLEDDGVAWGNPLLDAGSTAADYVLPDGLQNRIGEWLLTNTAADAFRTPADYYEENGIETVFDGRDAKPIGIPNYVVDPDEEDREHALRRSLGDLFERDQSAVGGHSSSDADAFYEQCMEMAMIRLARTRRALRNGEYELVFGYTSGLDLIGHVAYDRPDLQHRAYEELDQFVGELGDDLGPEDELLLVSDHGLQDGVHTHEAMVAATNERLVEGVESVTDVRAAIDAELSATDHDRTPRRDIEGPADTHDGDEVREQLENLGYM
ncbi:alkaline phosphatase family protein [Halostella pelagica]|uniref:alkaline phosphatase family protein n=1 Tax=Halostella pelagica TaxID=2583824 RepID=UPI001081D531|nr:alkaline phosphatase family protein [Halostella pelagica]